MTYISLYPMPSRHARYKARNKRFLPDLDRPCITRAAPRKAGRLRNGLYVKRSPSTAASSAYSQSAPSFPSAFHDFFKPQLHPITATKFTSQSGRVYSLPDQPRFTQSLGKKILILDIETRSVDGPGGLLDAELPPTNALHYLTFGRLSHYLFAQLHGYDYKLVRYPEEAHRHGAWNKVTAMREAIRHYDYVVFMDGDAIFTHPHLPLEWLLNYWAITDDTIVSLAQDPDAPLFYNLRGIDRNLNTGFIIAQQTPRSEEFFDAWETCPFNEPRYPGCAHTANGPMYDQTALNEWPRYEYADEIKILPCTEANRFPGSGDCEGEFVAHYWPDKDMVPNGVKGMMAQYFWPSLQQAFYMDQNSFVVAPHQIIH